MGLKSRGLTVWLLLVLACSSAAYGQQHLPGLAGTYVDEQMKRDITKHVEDECPQVLAWTKDQAGEVAEMLVSLLGPAQEQLNSTGDHKVSVRDSRIAFNLYALMAIREASPLLAGRVSADLLGHGYLYHLYWCHRRMQLCPLQSAQRKRWATPLFAAMQENQAMPADAFGMTFEEVHDSLIAWEPRKSDIWQADSLMKKMAKADASLKEFPRLYELLWGSRAVPFSSIKYTFAQYKELERKYNDILKKRGARKQSSGHQ